MKLSAAISYPLTVFAALTYSFANQEKLQDISPEEFPDAMSKVSGRVHEQTPVGVWIVSETGQRIYIATGALLEHKDTDFKINEFVSFICYKNEIQGQLKKEECARMVNLHNWISDGDPTPYIQILVPERPVFFAAFSSRPERNYKRQQDSNDEFRKMLRSRSEDVK
jgi:hypothetical protein